MKKATILVCAIFFMGTTYSQQVMMQGWYWDYPKTNTGNSWADTIRLKAALLKQAGFTHLWMPPHVPASFGAGSNGYDPKDLFIGNTTTGLGSRNAMDSMLTELTVQGLSPVADMIYNHRDGGRAENNPPVKAYITTHYTAAKEPFPSDRFRCALPLGGTTGNGEGDYYFKISSKTGDPRFNNYGYKLYMETSKMGFQNLPAQNEQEPNGGIDCGQGFDVTQLGRDMVARLEAGAGCGTDEFKLALSSTDFNAAGDTLFIYLTNNGKYADQRIYGLYSSGKNADVANELIYQTYTNFSGMPSGRGEMNYNFFKPNDDNASATHLNGDWDGMYFFYDYDQFQPQTRDTLISWTKWNWKELGIRGLRMDAVKHFAPSFVAQLLNSLHADGMDPSMVVGEWYSTNANELRGWVKAVLAEMTTSAKASIQPKIFDFTLRENLRRACDDNAFDVRQIFSGSLHDASGLSGFNVVTFVNNHDFRDNDGFASLIHHDPLLAYAYILTNNQLGVPTVYYPDYFGFPKAAGGLYGYHPNSPAAGSAELDRLMNALKTYISGSPSVEYLNRISTPFSSHYISGSANKVLIYQLSGHAGNGNKEVIVAINFGATALKVDHQINDHGGIISEGTKFTDVMQFSAFPYAVVNNRKQVYLELPAKSYSVWVQGTNPVIPLQLMEFTTRVLNKNVQLTWKVGNNGEIKNFEIERTEDGKVFSKVGGKLATAKTGKVRYDFVDARPRKKVRLLYRLKTVFKGGVEKYSDLRSAKIEE